MIHPVFLNEFKKENIPVAGNVVFCAPRYDTDIYFSTDSGENWTTLSFQHDFARFLRETFPCSADRKYIAFSVRDKGNNTDSVYYSSNYGQSFSEYNVSPNINILDVQVSNNGNIIFGGYSDKLHSSDQNFQNIVQQSSYKGCFTCLSRDGRYMFCNSWTESSAPLLVSNNFGQSFFAPSISGIQSANNTAFTCSASGNRAITSFRSGNQLVYTLNYGNNFTSIDYSSRVRCICTLDGYLAYCIYSSSTFYLMRPGETSFSTYSLPGGPFSTQVLIFSKRLSGSDIFCINATYERNKVYRWNDVTESFDVVIELANNFGSFVASEDYIFLEDINGDILRFDLETFTQTNVFSPPKNIVEICAY